MIPDTAFKNYDIRGIYGDNVTEELAYAVANAFAQKYNLTACLIGRDIRASSPSLTKQVIQGLRDAGCNVIDAGIVSTPFMKWAVAHKKLEGGLMISASHNPPEYNGFKFLLPGGLALGQDNGLWELKELLETPKTDGNGSYEEQPMLQEYIDDLTKNFSGSDRKLFIDPSGGSACREIKALLDTIELDATLYNAEEDPHFSAHPPNPLNPKAMEDAEEFCGMHKCIGVVFDADADRMMFVDEEGKTVPADYFGALLTKWIVPEGGGVTATVRDSRATKEEALKKGASFTLGKVGHANIQQLMVEKDYELGIEKSGHIFFKDVHFSEAPIHALLIMLEKLDGTLADAIKPYREGYFTSPETNFHVTSREDVITAAKEHYAQKGELNTMDGVLAEGESWWINIRASNTEPVVRLTFEAKDQETYKELQTEATALLEPFLAPEK